MIRLAVALLALAAGNAAVARGPAGLDKALTELARQGQFSGAVVIRDSRGVRFARGYGPADPFTGRPFTPDTPIDSASLAKPVTATTVLSLAAEGRINLDSPVQLYLPSYPHGQATVRHLLAHSAGLPFDDSPEMLAGKTNAALLEEVRRQRAGPLFQPGSAFSYCNLCTVTLALLIERVTGRHYLHAAREQVGLPPGVAIRPQRLAEWSGRAIGYRRKGDGAPERFDSWEGELFYGSGNLSISARQLAEWGAEWWRPALSRIRGQATQPAAIASRPSGLSWGNWYCAKSRRRCHYLGHHEGFHHMLYWDSGLRLSIAMVSNNTLAASLQQRLQRALVAFAEQRPANARKELERPLAGGPAPLGRFDLPGGETVVLKADGDFVQVSWRGLDYRAFGIGNGIRYVPGLDIYLSGAAGGGLHWLGLYEDRIGRATGKSAERNCLRGRNACNGLEKRAFSAED